MKNYISLTRQMLFGALLSFVVAPSMASAFPEHAIRMIVPYGPGGATDVATRIIADEMSKLLKQPIVVENKPGANGLIAIRQLASAKPDGYTLMVGNVTTNTINPIIQGAEMPLDVRKELTVVTKLVEVPAILIATKKNFPPSNIAELIAYAKTKPNQIFYNTAGILAYSHLDMLELQLRTGIELQMVPYSAGGGGGQLDIANGEVQLALRNVASAASFIKSGQIKALGVTTDSRLRSLPDVPTMKEQGFEGWGTNAWQALFAPQGTPDVVLEKINSAALEALKLPAVKQKFDDLQIEIRPTEKVADAREWLNGEYIKWQKTALDGKNLFAQQQKK